MISIFLAAASLIFIYWFIFGKVSTYPIPRKLIERDSLKKITCLIFIDWKNANPSAPKEDWETFFGNINLKYWKRERGYLGSPENINIKLRKALILKIGLESDEIREPLMDYFLEEVEMDKRIDDLISQKKSA